MADVPPAPAAGTPEPLCGFCGGDDFTTPSPLNYDLGNVYCIQCGSKHHTEHPAATPPEGQP